MVDYLVMEAVAVKFGQEEKEKIKQDEIDRWKQDTSKLEDYR